MASNLLAMASNLIGMLDSWEDMKTYKDIAIKQCRECRFSNGGQYFAAVNTNATNAIQARMLLLVLEHALNSLVFDSLSETDCCAGLMPCNLIWIYKACEGQPYARIPCPVNVLLYFQALSASQFMRLIDQTSRTPHTPHVLPCFTTLKSPIV